MSTHPPKTTAEAVFQRVRGHGFRPLEDGFTVDPQTGFDGVSELVDPDWRARTLALRDLARLGQDADAELIAGLKDESPHVRQLSAMALGVRGVDAAAEPLGACLQADKEPIVRSQTAVALGQLAAAGDLLQERAEADPSADVRHQCALAVERARQGARVEPELARAFATLDEAAFGRVRAGDPAPDFELEDTDGHPWRLSDLTGAHTVVLIWIFADWCPVCHHEFHDLIAMRERAERLGVQVLTLECQDRFRARVMAGQELLPAYWFAKNFDGQAPQARYAQGRWWPHLVDRAAAVGLRYGVDPWQFAVHSEYVNRPSTVIVAPDGTVRLAYFGTYWGDRPTIEQTLDMVESGRFEFEAPPPRRAH